VLFNSHIFIFGFLPAALLLFYAAARVSSYLALAVLALASIVFYAWDSPPEHVVVLLISIAGNFAIGRFVTQSFDANKTARCRWLLALGIAITFVAVVIAWVFFRADSVAHAGAMMQSMFAVHGLSPPQSTLTSFGDRAAEWPYVKFDGLFHNGVFQHPGEAIALVLPLLVIVWMMPNTQQLFARYRPALIPWRDYVSRWHWRPNLAWSVGCAALFAAAIFAISLFPILRGHDERVAQIHGGLRGGGGGGAVRRRGDGGELFRRCPARLSQRLAGGRRGNQNFVHQLQQTRVGVPLPPFARVVKVELAEESQADCFVTGPSHEQSHRRRSGARFARARHRQLPSRPVRPDLARFH
jgi:hypothetical protein